MKTAVIAAISLWFASTASAQTPRVPPDTGFILHEEKAVDRFVVQRWVSAANPEVSPPGFCECMTVVYEGARQVLEEHPDDAETSRCAALGPALGLFYTGRVAQGQALFRKLYRRPDARAVERKALEMARASPLWIAL
ncbi:MAG: hypothetical protein A3H97_07220 [Acidobacteria bacterium RIFCSPLOWO2_02_FULL_65_29]|nr:MAG: hypothetical protein A3H97_07220 [Acidobacteria bacterium RIFCSPLOWO2_02_FULL_65_29]